MIDLFSPEGLAALERLSRQRALYAFDFDGTLSPIVARPDDARASPETNALLASLAALVPTAIVTGRGSDDLKRRLEFTPLHLVGDHGSEGLPEAMHHSLADAVSGQGGNAKHRAIVSAWLAQCESALAEGPSDGIVVEAKKYSVSIHYRAAPDADAARAAIHALIARLDPQPRLIGGKCVVNLLPEGAPDKGRALALLVRHEQCDAAFFIGDDVTDEAAFVDAPSSWVTVKVGHDERSAARYFITDQHDIDRCLALLIANASVAAP